VVTLIGATTENPYFEVNSALLSRARVYELDPLSAEEVQVLLDRAIARGECGPAAEVAPDALSFLAQRAGGDARIALNALELACEAAGNGGTVTLANAEDALQQRALLYDRQADRHYDTISAWIKATRGSDPDASLYYLAVMLEGGEDPRFIVRRMVVLASEDIGNADPQALVIATAAAQAVEHVGMPECQFALAQAAIYLSLAPKSDAAKRALGAVREWVRDRGAEPPPRHLRSSTRSDGNYDNPHRRPGHTSPQELMPDSVIGRRFYEPDEAEALLRERLEEIRRERGRS
jgi:putative ATPase